MPSLETSKETIGNSMLSKDFKSEDFLKLIFCHIWLTSFSDKSVVSNS